MTDRPRLAYRKQDKVYYVPDPELAKAVKRRREFWEMAASSIYVGAALCWVAFAIVAAISLSVAIFVEFIPKYGLRGLYAVPIIVGLISSVVLLFKIADKKRWI